MSAPVRVVTDSTCDIPADIAGELGITVVPLYLRVGDQTYRDGEDIDIATLKRERASDKDLRGTSAPSPGDFAQVYENLARGGNEIISLHLSSGYSGTYNSARLAQGYLKDKCRVVVLDSNTVSAGLGLLVMAAADAARKGNDLDEIESMVQGLIPRTHLFGRIDNLADILSGKRLHLTRWLIFSGQVAMRAGIRLAGELYDGGKIRRASIVPGERRALGKLKQWAEELSPVKEIAVAHALNPGKAEMLIGMLEGITDREHMRLMQMGCITTAYVGAGTVAIAVIQEN